MIRYMSIAIGNMTLTASLLALAAALALLSGCATENEAGQERVFHTSGSREADQRAEQRMAREAQIRGGAEASEAVSLYDRLGGDRGIAMIVDDFVNRAMADPRANWRRTGVTSGGFLNIGGRSAEWDATDEDIRQLKQHMFEFLALATGGPSEYRGRSMRQVHRGMAITNAEFDATIGDLKATLDALRVPTEEQKELIAILESTRPQVVEVK